MANEVTRKADEGKPASSNAALAAMDPELKKLVEPVLREVRAVGAKTLIAYRQLGAVVDTVLSNEAKYGSDAMGQLAACFGMSRAMLSQAQSVAKTMSESFVADLAKKQLPNGSCITQTHLVALAQKPTDKARAAALQDLLEKGMTVKELADSTPKSGGAGGRPKKAPKDLPSAIEQLRRNVVSANRSLELAKEFAIDPLKVVSQADMDKAILDAVVKVDEQLTILGDNVLSIQTAIQTANTGIVARLKRGLNIVDEP